MTSGERKWLAAAVAFSVVVRLVLAGAVLLVRGDVEAFHTSDSARYLELGASLARFEGFGTGGRPELFRLPGFPLLVALGSWMGNATTATILLHAVLGGLTTGLCFFWGRAATGPTAGIVAAWLYALEPGQWTWSSLVLTETLFTTLLAGAGLASTRYLKHGHRTALLWAIVAAAACAYVRLVGYVLPFVILGACALLAGRSGSVRGRQGVWRDAAVATMLAILLLGAWHARNGLTSGYWGFSTQLERAAFIVGGGVADARNRGSYTESATALRREIERYPDRGASALAAEMRRSGLQRIAEAPLTFFSTYAAGIAATLVHPGTGGFMRLFTTGVRDDQASVTQMLTLGRFDAARRLAAEKGTAYWLVAGALFIASLIYLALFLAGAWAGRRSALILLPCAMAGGILLLSGGPDGDSRRRAPLVPIISVVASTLRRRGARCSASASPLARPLRCDVRSSSEGRTDRG